MIFRYWWINQRNQKKEVKELRLQIGLAPSSICWNATGMMPELGSNCQANGKWGNFIWILLLKRGCTLKWAILKVCRDTSAVCVIHPVGFERGKNGIPIINPKLKKHPLLKDFQILARDTVNGTYLFLQIETSRYCVSIPSLKNWDTWLDEIILKCRANTSDDLIILGDFKCSSPWMGRIIGITERKSKLKNWMESNELERKLIPAPPTYVTARGNSIVDHVH